MSVLRRLVLMAAIAATTAAVVAWWRQRAEDDLSMDPPSWPAFTPPTTEPTPVDNGAAMSSWVIATDDGTAPDGYPIKVKVSSGIFHLPGGRFYDRTNPDRWYATAEAALADGYRQSKT
ncbi:MAG: hypothetical protein WBL31_15040 [Ilumatobacteraceae bacterium]|jgi:hypothetical protein